MTGWLGGLHIHGGHGTTTADLLCTACWYHRRVVGKANVIDFVRSNPVAHHRATCPATKTT